MGIAYTKKHTAGESKQNEVRNASKKDVGYIFTYLAIQKSTENLSVRSVIGRCFSHRA